MIDFSFIRLSASLEAAHNTQESPIVTYDYLGQIQLKPLDPKPYVQTTRSSVDIETRNPNAFLVDCYGVEHDITRHFSTKGVTDANGIKQLKFMLAYLPIDHGHNLVYLKLNQLGFDTLYSNKFLVTDYNINLTSRIDYIDTRGLLEPDGFGPDPNLSRFHQSIRLSFYFNNYVSKDELSTYYQISTSQIVNPRVSVLDLNEYIAEGFNAWTFKRLKRAFYSGRAYIDFVRNYPYEGFEFNARAELSSISSNTFLTDPNEDDVLVVDDVIINIPDPPQWTYDTLETFDSARIIFNE